MTASHQTILAELYEIDPALREHEAELVPLIAQLLERDPAQKPSPAFVKKLRKELQNRGADTNAVEYRMEGTVPFLSLFHRFAFAAAGATLAVLIAVPVTLQLADDSALPPAADPYDIDETAMKAGQPTTPPLPLTGGTENSVAPMYARPQSGGGGGDMMMDGKMSAVSSMIAPWNPVKYRLEGDLPALPQGEVDVLERNLRTINVPFSGIQSAFREAAIDLSSFDDTSVDHLSVTQRRPFGYTINLSMQDGSVSINQAWEFWPHPESDCRDEACYERLRPKISDIPADAELLRIAGAFIDEHEIDLSSYGDPVIDTAWRREYDRTEDKRMAWVPDSIRVIYPLVIDGHIVTEAGGGPSGISVQVSIKHKRVSDVWGLMTYEFDRTNHAAVSDRADIERFLAMSGGQTPEAPTVTLRDPTIGFVRLYTYEDGANKELFVPALIFQVTNLPKDIYYYQTSVAVPLSKELLDEAELSLPIDPPQPGTAAAEESL